MRKKGITVYLDVSDIEKLQTIENKTGIKVSTTARQAVKEFLEKKRSEAPKCTK